MTTTATHSTHDTTTERVPASKGHIFNGKDVGHGNATLTPRRIGKRNALFAPPPRLHAPAGDHPSPASLAAAPDGEKSPLAPRLGENVVDLCNATLLGDPGLGVEPVLVAGLL